MLTFDYHFTVLCSPDTHAHTIELSSDCDFRRREQTVFIWFAFPCRIEVAHRTSIALKFNV